MSDTAEPNDGSGRTVKITVGAYARGFLALHISYLYLIQRFVGPTLWPVVQRDLTPVLDQMEHTPWGRFIQGRFCELVGRAPELVPILEQSDGLERALDIFCEAAEPMLSQQVSDQELDAGHKQLASAMGQLETELAIVQGDGKPPLGEEMEIDLESVANEPLRMYNAIPPRALGLGKWERGNLKASLGVSS